MESHRAKSVQRGLRSITIPDTDQSISVGGHIFNQHETNTRSTTTRNQFGPPGFFSGPSTMRSRRTSQAGSKWDEQQSIGFSDNQIDKILNDCQQSVDKRASR